MVTLNINNHEYDVEADADELLVWVIREKVGLTETKFGCGMQTCGACTVLVDGNLLHTCVTKVSNVLGKKIITREGFKGDDFSSR